MNKIRKMKKIISITTIIFFLLNRNYAQNATFTDCGFVPDTGVSIISDFQTSIYNNDKIFIATTDGVWAYNLLTQVWESAGLQGKTITFIYKHPAIAGKIYAGAIVNANNTNPLFISDDNGATWVVAGNAAETFSNIVARPGNPNHLYAGTYYGFNFMISTDAGNNWVYFNNGQGGATGYTVNLAFLPSNSNQLFYGSENPLDDARIDRYDINTSNPTQLDNLHTIVSRNVFSNRRPVKLHTYSYTGNYLYVGQEGALSKVNTDNVNDVTFIYKSVGEPDKPYSYMYGHWTDPNDTNHLIFGGNLNGDNTGLMQLYETFDEGVTFYRYTDTFGVAAPMVRDIVEINSDKLAIVINDQNNDGVKLVVMELSASSITEKNATKQVIDIYPNPASDYIIIKAPNNKSKPAFEIYNSLGQLIKRQTNILPNQRISVSTFPKGIYFIRIIMPDKTITKKVVLK